ncbi:hypothetical protein ACLESD_54200, partial [Pyxidicoccus sp. 3LFB2]
VNLPNNEETLEAIIDKSVRKMTIDGLGKRVKANPRSRKAQPRRGNLHSVLEDVRNNLIIGTSMIIA